MVLFGTRVWWAGREPIAAVVCWLLGDAGIREDEVGTCLQFCVHELVLSKQRVPLCSSSGTCCCSRKWSRTMCGEDLVWWGWISLRKEVPVLFGGGAGGLCGVRLLYEAASSSLRPRFNDFARLLLYTTFTSSSQFLPVFLPGFGMEELREEWS